MKTFKLLIKGRVQGVCFRRFVRSNALLLGIRGYVMNLPDGDVLAVVQGEEDNLNQMIDLCWKGPELANVTGIRRDEIKSEDLPGFNIRF